MLSVNNKMLIKQIVVLLMHHLNIKQFDCNMFFNFQFSLQNDSKFILRLCTIGYYLGFVSYKPNKYKISLSRILYLILLFILFIAMAYIYVNNVYSHYYMEHNKFERFLLIFSGIAHVLVVISLYIQSNWLSTTNWMKFFNDLIEIDKRLKYDFKFVDKKPMVFHYIDSISVFITVFVVVRHLYGVSKYFKEIQRINLNFCFLYINYITTALVLNLIISFLLYIKRRFNHLLEYFNGNIKNCSSCDIEDDEIVNQIRNGIQMFRKLSNHFKNFNSIFDWFLFFYIIQSTIESFRFIFHNMLTEDKHLQRGFEITIMLFFILRLVKINKNAKMPTEIYIFSVFL